MRHNEIWRALDILAAENGLSPSGLARKAGLDPTTFNRSKRQMPDGRARWPSTESLAKALDAAGASLEMFSHLIAGDRAFATGTNRPRRIPLIGMAQAGGNGYFDDAGFPVGGAWDEVDVPELQDPQSYALEISGNSMEPVFRHGDIVVVSPSTPIRSGDRVVVRTTCGETMAKQFFRQSPEHIKVKSLNSDYLDYTFHPRDVVWMHRIVWSTQ